MPIITEYPEDAKYNIKSVSLRTGVQPVTLRAWERRYKILDPHRGENGYRLYSERDVALLAWLKNQVDAGVSISAAVENFRAGARNGIWPEAVITAPAPIASKHSSLPAADFVKRMLNPLIARDELTASKVFEEALASFDLLPLCEEVLCPTLVEIGEAWYHGKILVATEHFASGFIRSKLLAIYQSLPVTRHPALIMVGGAPGELHEIGPLMTATLLRNAGYRVEYLGPDLPLDDLILYIKDERPKMVILSATLEDSASAIEKFDKSLRTLRTKPLFGFGGPVYNRRPELVSQTSGIFLGNTISQSLKMVQTLLEGKRKEPLAG